MTVLIVAGVAVLLACASLLGLALSRAAARPAPPPEGACPLCGGPYCALLERNMPGGAA